MKGDERIFSMVYDRFYKALYNYGCKYTRNTELIEDAIQDLFVRFWKSRARLNEPPSLKNYLFKAFRNHMIDRLKVAGRYVLDDLGGQYAFELVPSVEDDRVAMEKSAITKQKLSAAMVRLTDRQREAIFLRFYEEFSYLEIAEMMGITVKATYKLMARSIDVVREGLDGDNVMVLLLLFKRALSSHKKS